MLVHLIDSLDHGFTRIQVRTVDSDVVVIQIGQFHKLLSRCPDLVLWVAFGMGKNFTYYKVNDICSELGYCASRCLPIFHSLTGCDTTSAFVGIGKKTAYKVWMDFEEVNDAFMFISDHPFCNLHTNEAPFKLIEQYIVKLYDRSSTLSSVSACRKDLFCHHDKSSLDQIPPTQVSSNIFSGFERLTVEPETNPQLFTH